MAFVMQNGARRGAIQISCKEEIPLAHCVRLWNGVRRRAIQCSCKEEIPLAHCVRLRNGARRQAREGEKEGRRKKKFRNPKTCLRRPSFSLFDPVRDAPFRETRQR